MLKFIRKYNLIILAIGGTLLMIVFLLEPVISRLGINPENARVAEIGPAGSKVTRGERYQASREVSTINQFLPVITSELMLGLENETDHWLLLTYEAERAGFIGGPSEGFAWIQELARDLAELQMLENLRGAPPDLVQQILASPGMRQQMEQQRQAIEDELMRRRAGVSRAQRMSDREFDQILARARGVFRMLQLYQQAPRLSDREAMLRAKDALDSGVADYLVLPAGLVMDDVPRPDEEAIREHFETFREVRPGDGEYGLGYRLPARVRLEWLRVSYDAVAETVRLDPVDVRRRWSQNRDEYPGEFGEERERVERAMRRARTEELMGEAERYIRSEIVRVTRALDREGAMRVLPEDWDGRRPRLERVAETVVEVLERAEGVRMPLPEYRSRTDRWLTGADLRQVPGLGRSRARVGAQEVEIGELPGMVLDTGGEGLFPVQVGLPVSEATFRDPDGNRYYVAALDARPESAPDALDEVRERVVADLRELQGYRRLLEEAETYAQIARSEGLGTIASLFSGTEDERLRPSRAVRFFRDRIEPMRWGEEIDWRADEREVREAVVREARRRLDPLTPPDEIDADGAVLTVEIPSRRALAVVRLLGHRPMTAEAYRAMGSRVVTGSIRQDLEEVRAGINERPFGFAALASRLQYRLTSAAAREELEDFDPEPEQEG